MQSDSPFYRLASDFVLYTSRSIFLTGKAGTGKTTFLHRLKHETRKQMAVVAPTGVAAINAGGTTMHSFFQLPFTPFMPTPEGRKNLIEKLHMQSARRKVLQELELLVIDEISMVRADVLDAVDTILRYVRYRQHEPFGGVQMLFIGDMFQLSPVVTEDEWRWLSQYYKSPYFFHSQVVLQQPPVYIELDKIFRQSNADFVRLLNEVRNNCLSESGLKMLQSRYNPAFVPPKDDTYITLTTHNYKADKINEEELAQLQGKTYRFKAEIKGEYPEKSYPTELELELKIGAKVMFLKNDMEAPRRYFNGKIAVVEDVDEEAIVVRCLDDSALIEVHKDVWRNIRYTADPKTQQIEECELGTFTQYPLRLAWAITIHKSQGLTFDKAVIDAGDAFAAGQVYVALSRCRSLEGLVLLSRIQPQAIQNDRTIVEYERNKLPVEYLETQLEQSKNEYRRFVLNALFEFGTLEGRAVLLRNGVKEHEKSFNAEALPYAEQLVEQAHAMHDVASRFQSQLQGLLNRIPVDEEFLQGRIGAAAAFFNGKLDELMQALSQSPVVTDSRSHASEYNDDLKELFLVSAQKRFLLDKLKERFTVEDYFILKNTFIAPDFKQSAYAGSTTAKVKKEDSRHPDLYKALVRCRHELCEPQGTPVYLVAQTKTLLEMADYLPQTPKELLSINGFGQAKVEKYGDAFLDVIHDYCLKHDLGSLMHEKEDTRKRKKKEKKEKKEKEPKIESRKVTLGLYQQGKSIDEIMAERDLALSTIVSHLVPYLGNEVDIDEFISFEKRQQALLFMESMAEKEQSPYAALKEMLSPVEFQFFMAWLRIGKP